MPLAFRDKYGVQMIMRFNEIHKFSDGTLQQIDEALDYRVKEFKGQQDESGFEHTVLDKERCRQKQGVHVCYRKMAFGLNISGPVSYIILYINK
ncbi:hypothetical protein Tco_1340677 [Tanacetum coccineum]